VLFNKYIATLMEGSDYSIVRVKYQCMSMDTVCAT